MIWTEVERSVITRVEFTVTGAPAWTELPSCEVTPTHVFYWIVDGQVRSAGIQGEITAGTGSKSGGSMATTWPLAQAPGWVQAIAEEIVP